MLKSFSIIIVMVVTASICFSQINNNSKSKRWENEISTVNNYNVNVVTPTEQRYKIGLNSGYHSQNLSNNNSFTGDLLLELYLGFILSDEVSMLMGFSYWKAETQQTSNPEYLIPSEIINSKAFKLKFEFSLIKIYDVSLLLGPSVSIGGLTGATNAIFAFGADLKLSIPLWQERLSVFTSANYENGSEILNVGGGGSHYSFFGISIGAEIFI